MAIMFPVSDVEIPSESLRLLDHDASVRSLLRGRIEAVELNDTRLVHCTTEHPFAKAAYTAFYDHYPLVISPDDVWFCLAQGFAQHVTQNAEALRSRFVQHEGKKKLIVNQPDFTLGQPNPWPEVFTAFSNQIAEHVGKIRDVIVPSFTTTQAVHRAACEVALMDTFQGYFKYELRAGCGIPQITLLGTPEDWHDIRLRAQVFSEYGLEWWINALIPVLEKLEATAAGHIDASFWRSFFRYESGSGPNEMTGWIMVLFPYLRDYRKDRYGNALQPNLYLKTWENGWLEAETRTDWRQIWGNEQGPSLDLIPSGLASAPVKMIDLHKGLEHDARFVAGMMGVAQDFDTLVLQPSFGWAIIYEN